MGIRAKLYFLLAIFVSSLILSCQAVDDLRSRQTQHLSLARASPWEEFRKWTVKHSKPYLNDLYEFERRFEIWVENLEYILQYNSRSVSHWLGLNSLADLTVDEYKHRYLGFDYDAYKRLYSNQARSFSLSSSSNSTTNQPIPKHKSSRLPGSRYSSVSLSKIPASIDWRDHNAVTPVKNQGQCGSCWAFSTTGSVEGANAIFTKTLVSLSEQELIDCDRNLNQGCSGGLMDPAFDFIVNNNGIDTESHYPYTASDDQCDITHRNHHVVTIDGYEDVQPNEVDLKKAAAHQPVSVAIEADAKSFQLYGGGVYDDIGCGVNLNHGVLVVGYGVEKNASADPSNVSPIVDNGTANSTDVPYWIVKNSWGPEWGDSGYIRIKIGGGAVEGLCGIALVASYPVKNHPNPAPSPDAPLSPPAAPPPPPPAPERCDSRSTCPSGSTCCCVTQLFGQCFIWGCCPFEGATCCADGQHCCSRDFPVCDPNGDRCLRAHAEGREVEESIPWKEKRMSTQTTDRIQAMANWMAQWRGSTQAEKEGGEVTRITRRRWDVAQPK